MGKFTDREIEIYNQRQRAQAMPVETVSRVITVGTKTSFEMFKDEIGKKFHEANKHPNYENLMSDVRQAFLYIEKYNATVNKFEQASMKAGYEVAETLIEDAYLKFEDMNSQIQEQKEKKEQARQKAKLEFDKLMKKHKLDATVKSLVLAVEEIDNFAKRNDITGLTVPFLEAIRSLKQNSITY